MRQKLGAENLENMAKFNSASSSESDASSVSTPLSVSHSQVMTSEKKSRPPKMRLKKYLEVDTEVCQKRPQEHQNLIVDKKRKLNLDIPNEVTDLLNIFIIL